MTTNTKVTKMSVAKQLWSEIHAEGFVVPEGSSTRQEFINRAMKEIGLTLEGAKTYHHNIKREFVDGKSLYIRPQKKVKKQLDLF